MTFKYHYIKLQPMVTDYREDHQTLLSVGEINLEACTVFILTQTIRTEL